MAELYQAIWDDVEKEISITHPKMLEIFEPQIRLRKIEIKLDLLSVVYFLQKNPEKVNLALSMMAWHPRWEEGSYYIYDGAKHDLTDVDAFNELLSYDPFKKLYEMRMVARRDLDAVKDKDEFKEAAHLIYRAIINHKDGKEAEDLSQKTIED